MVNNSNINSSSSINNNNNPLSMDTFQRELEVILSSTSSHPREDAITTMDNIPKSLIQTWLTLPSSIRTSLISYSDSINRNIYNNHTIDLRHPMPPRSIDTTATTTQSSSSISSYNTSSHTNQEKVSSSSSSSSMTYDIQDGTSAGIHSTTTNHPSVDSLDTHGENNSNNINNNNNNHMNHNTHTSSSSSSYSISSCDENGTTLTLIPLDRAPENVFAFTKTHTEEYTQVLKTRSSTVTTTTQVLTTSHGWRNIFNVPISYDITVLPYGTLFDPTNPQLLQSTGIQPEGYNRRFAVIDDQVYTIYGDKIQQYFTRKGIELTVCILPGGEVDKRPTAVHTLLDQLCVYKLRRREPFLAIGGGVLLDIAGMAACLYRRGVPFVRVPTTLLAIVDASVGVKNGVDYCCPVTDETYKNRIGSFYAPTACLLDKAFIATQDSRNISNGFGEILKLALVRSIDLFELLEAHGQALIESKLMPNCTIQDGISDRIIDLSIQIMLEELGPNLWETKLDRCVDYGHTFSKLLEMVPGVDIMHGEAVNIDGFFCVILSYLRGYINLTTVQRISMCMKSLSLPTYSSYLTAELAWQSCKDAIEHRNGEQRIPLITEIGDYICVSDITPEEINRGLVVMQKML